MKRKLLLLLKNKPKRYYKSFYTKNAKLYIEKDSENSWHGWVMKDVENVDHLGNIVKTYCHTNYIYGYATALRAFLVLRRIAK